MQRKTVCFGKGAGFTLAELLGVVAVTAVITAVLLPVFSAARERARRTTCLSNLGQIALAVQQYVQDNDKTYPSPNWVVPVYPYVKSDPILIYPDQSGFLEGDGHFTSYDYDWSRLCVILNKHTIRGAQEAAVATPATVWLNVDSAWNTPDSRQRYWRDVPHTSCGREYSGSILHNDGGNYSYADGHARWLTPEQAGEVDCANSPLPPPFKS